MYKQRLGGPGILYLDESPTRLQVVEELIHLGQFRRLGWRPVRTYEGIVRLEIGLSYHGGNARLRAPDRPESAEQGSHATGANASQPHWQRGERATPITGTRCRTRLALCAISFFIGRESVFWPIRQARVESR
jgi:hypothetical protein